MKNYNDIQMEVLTKLLFSKKARFKELNTQGLATDTFSYHIRELTKNGLITKDKNYYKLTNLGKTTASKIDTDTKQFEKQPKVSVIVIPVKKDRGVTKYLVHQRRKHPYFGYWGFISGKVRWGETIAESSTRELKEETGLVGKIKFEYEIHEMVYDKKTGEMLEDKFFQIVSAKKISGTLVDTKDGINKWVTKEQFLKLNPLFHNEIDVLNWYLNKDNKFKEEKYYIETF